MSDSRIQDRRNAFWQGRAVTTFKYFERRGDAYVFSGDYSAPGHNASTEKCIDSALEKCEHDDEEN